MFFFCSFLFKNYYLPLVRLLTYFKDHEIPTCPPPKNAHILSLTSFFLEIKVHVIFLFWEKRQNYSSALHTIKQLFFLGGKKRILFWLCDEKYWFLLFFFSKHELTLKLQIFFKKSGARKYLNNRTLKNMNSFFVNLCKRNILVKLHFPHTHLSYKSEIRKVKLTLFTPPLPKRATTARPVTLTHASFTLDFQSFTKGRLYFPLWPSLSVGAGGKKASRWFCFRIQDEVLELLQEENLRLQLLPLPGGLHWGTTPVEENGRGGLLETALWPHLVVCYEIIPHTRTAIKQLFHHVNVFQDVFLTESSQ